MIKYRKIFFLERGLDKYTEEYVYNNRGDYNLFSGNTLNYGLLGRINTYDKELEEGILYTTVGVKAGTLFFINGKYSLSQNCRVIHLRDEFKDKLNLKYFYYNHKASFKLAINGRFNNPSITDGSFYRLKLKIRDYKEQLKILDLFEKADDLKNLIFKTINALTLLDKNISLTKFNHQVQKYKVSKIFNIKGGNSGLTEEFIYYNLPETEEDKIEILTGATLERTAMGVISKNARPKNKNLKLFEGPAVLVVRKGIAGMMTYIPKGTFTTNDDAYVLTPKKAWKDKINLEWFISEYQELFWKIVTSKSDNSTFGKDYAERQIIQLPHIDEQNRIMQKLTPLKVLIQKLHAIENKIDKLLEYTIV